jgi:hypothetical protein
MLVLWNILLPLLYLLPFPQLSEWFTSNQS